MFLRCRKSAKLSQTAAATGHFSKSQYTLPDIRRDCSALLLPERVDTPLGLGRAKRPSLFFAFLASHLEFGCWERMWGRPSHRCAYRPNRRRSARVRPHRLPSVPSNGPHFTRHCCPGGLQSWPQAVADRPAVRLVPIRCALAARRGHGCVGADFRQHWSLLQNCWAPRVGDIG